MSRKTGPRCGVSASRNASAARAPMVAGSFRVHAAFVTGPRSAGWSNSCNEPEPHRASGARPPTTTIGAPLKNPVANADTALVTPGPAVTAANPGVRFSRPVASAAKTAVASWRTSSRRTAPSRSAAAPIGCGVEPLLAADRRVVQREDVGTREGEQRGGTVGARRGDDVVPTVAGDLRIRSCSRCFHRDGARAPAGDASAASTSCGGWGSAPSQGTGPVGGPGPPIRNLAPVPVEWLGVAGVAGRPRAP